MARLRHHLPPETMTIAGPEAGVAMVNGDVDELRSVISNLLDNAVKYSRDQVRVAVDVSVAADDVVRIRVRRRGRGHPAGAAQADLPALPSLPVAWVESERHGPGPLHRAVDRQAARRTGHGHQRRRGPRLDVHHRTATAGANLMARLLVVEDEPHLALGLQFNLQADGHVVERRGRWRGGLVAPGRRGRQLGRRPARRDAAGPGRVRTWLAHCGRGATTSRS